MPAAAEQGYSILGGDVDVERGGSREGFECGRVAAVCRGREREGSGSVVAT